MIQVANDFTRFEKLEHSAGTNPTSWQRRILSQLRFAQTVGGEKEAGKAAAALEAALARDGVITNQAAEEAEKILLPLAAEAKSYQFLCVGHAHIDMNWMWGFQETVGVTIDTFRTMLQIMEEYPGFIFSQSQASVYRILEDYAPELLEQVRSRVEQGRWELTASSWVETDKNMPSGESLSRHILYTKNYLSGLFGVNPASLDIDFSPDTFGHSENIPEIDANGGVKYYYHCRGRVGDPILCRWRSPSGAELILYTEPFWYNGEIAPDTAETAPELARQTGSRTLLKVYGVGDHGGGPTRRDLDRMLEMDGWPVYPRFRCATLREYFQSVEARRESLPLILGEQNFLCDGCYTSQTRIKAGNRRSERLLGEAELFAVQAQAKTGAEYSGKIFADAWKKVLFNHFHDIIPGSGVTETREYASALHQEAGAAADARLKEAFSRLTGAMDTSSLIPAQDLSFTRGEGGGAGSGSFSQAAGKTRIFHLFQPLPWQREETAEFTIWDYEGCQDRLGIRTAEGQWVPSQIVEKGKYWEHTFTRLLAQVKVPACGSAVYLAGEQPVKAGVSFFNDMRVQSPDTFVLENRLVRAEFSPEDGALVSLVEKASGREMIPQGKRAGFLLAMEADWKEVTGWEGGMSAWFTGRQKAVSPVANVELRMLPGGQARSRMAFSASLGGASALRGEVYLDEGSRAIRYQVSCDWREYGGKGQGVPALLFTLPEAVSGGQYLYDVPFGFVEREGREMDLPANRFVLAGEKGPDVLLLTSSSKYGYRCGSGRMSVTLIRGSYDPDPTPEVGMHRFELALLPAPGGQPRAVYSRMVQELEMPIRVVSGRPHGGCLPAEGMFLEMGGSPAILSSIKGAESGEKGVCFLRIYETEGKDAVVSFRCGFDLAEASWADTLEQPADGGLLEIDGRVLRISLKPFQAANIRIKLK